MLGAAKSEDPRLTVCVITFEVTQRIWPRYLNFTDGYSISVPVANTALCRASRGKEDTSYLAPDEHAAEDNLKTVEEVVADDDDRCSAGRPTFIGTDRFDRRRRSAQETCTVSK